MLRHEFGILFWIHLTVIAVSIISPLLFGVGFIVMALLIFLAQGLVLGECVLTRFQFGSRSDVQGFCAYYLAKTGLTADPSKINFYVDRVQPFLILFTAVIWQWLLGFQPFFS